MSIQIKKAISITEIGKFRFFTGIILGCISAIIFSLLFNASRESLRFFTMMSNDLYVPGKDEFWFFNYFFASLSSVLSLSVCIHFWFGKRLPPSRKRRILRLSNNNILLIFWVTLLVITRFGSILPFIFFGLTGYDRHLNFYEDFWYLFVLIPIVIFMQNWYMIRIIYFAGKWILYSFIICTFLTIILAHFTKVDQESLNTMYLNQYRQEYSFIESEIKRAKGKYDIHFKNETIQILKEWTTESATFQFKKVKNAFSSQSKVSLDTIILAQIIVHNVKHERYIYHPRNSLVNWPFALPSDIHKQIKKYDPSDPETKEMFELLAEQIKLFNTPHIGWGERENYSKLEIKRYNFLHFRKLEPVIKQLKEARRVLISEPKYAHLHSVLPELKIDPSYRF